MSKLKFFKKKIWHMLDYNEMHLFWAFYNFAGIVFDVEVNVRYRKI